MLEPLQYKINYEIIPVLVCGAWVALGDHITYQGPGDWVFLQILEDDDIQNIPADRLGSSYDFLVIVFWKT